MKIFYSPHAIMRIGQKGVTELDIEHIINYPTMIRRSYSGREAAYGTIKNKMIRQYL